MGGWSLICSALGLVGPCAVLWPRSIGKVSHCYERETEREKMFLNPENARCRHNRYGCNYLSIAQTKQNRKKKGLAYPYLFSGCVLVVVIKATVSVTVRRMSNDGSTTPLRRAPRSVRTPRGAASRHLVAHSSGLAIR